MAYFLYAKKGTGESDSYVRRRETSIAGSVNGIVSRYLRLVATPTTAEPWLWHIPMTGALGRLEADADAFVIDLKPDDRVLVSLYEVRNVWGFTSSGWTPMMLELETLLVDERREHFDKREFTIPRTGREQVATFLYLNGGVENGALTGPWTFPRPSSTNSALLWPDALAYFVRQLGYQAPAGRAEAATPGAQPDARLVVEGETT